MQYTIGETAKQMNISAPTLRYYDKEGLLPHIHRSPGGIRVFEEDDFEWLRFIECLKKSGLSIKEIKQFVDWYLEGDATIEQRRELFYARKRAIEQEMEELQHTLDFVTYKCWFYDMAAAVGSTDTPHAIKSENLPPEIRKLKESSGVDKY